MKTFAQLLSDYITRLGLSDAELARTLGVRRQTIFRWREGLTTRPRHRDDVLLLAKKLRLTPEERDELLLSAGFAPLEGFSEIQPSPVEARPSSKYPLTTPLEIESRSVHPPAEIVSPPAETLSPPDASRQSAVTDVTTADKSSPRWRRAIIISGLFLLAVAVGLVILSPDLPWLKERELPTLTLSLTPAVSPTPTVESEEDILPAQPGETLILVANFANYAGEQIGYNVAGRLSEALRREIGTARLENMRVEIWAEPIALRQFALRAGQAVSATLIIYGEYDAGRVVAQFAYPAAEQSLVEAGVLREVADLQALAAVINGELPQQVRSLALLTLGQIYVQQGQSDRARQVLEQAQRNLTGEAKVDDQTWGALNFFLGIAYQQSDPPQFEAALIAYTETLRVRPGLISARLNRASTYHARRQTGDLELALADINEVIRLAPDWAAAYNNRAAILMGLSDPAHLAQAEADLDQALRLEPALVSAYVNRAILRFQQGRPVEDWKSDLDQALTLKPDQAAAYNMLCWGYAIEEQADQALTYCEQAVTLEPDPNFIDSRGLAQALLGNYPAAMTDFETFIVWLEAQPPGAARDTTLAQRRAWVEALRAGENPFTPEVLAELREQ